MEQEFYLTFGVQYPREPHPTWSGADKNGWVKIIARDEPAARQLAIAHFRQHWSMLYPADHFDEEENKLRYYPLGQLAVITSKGMEGWDSV